MVAQYQVLALGEGMTRDCGLAYGPAPIETTTGDPLKQKLFGLL